MKYKKEIKPDIKFQTDKIFVRTDLFEQVIKTCKATNIEFAMFNEKLGICLYEENYYTEEIIQIQDEKPVEKINKVSNKKLTTKVIDESDNESTKKLINKSINEPVNSNMTSWYDTDKFNKILASIDNNNFNHKNKIDKLQFNDINNLINSIKSNAISEAGAKKN